MENRSGLIPDFNSVSGYAERLAALEPSGWSNASPAITPGADRLTGYDSTNFARN